MSPRRALEAAIVPLIMKRPTLSKLAQDHGRRVRLAGDFHLARAEMAATATARGAS